MVRVVALAAFRLALADRSRLGLVAPCQDAARSLLSGPMSLVGGAGVDALLTAGSHARPCRCGRADRVVWIDVPFLLATV
jgi:hypothetical protein